VGRYDNPIPTRIPAPIDYFKIPAMVGRYDNPIPTRFPAPIDCYKIPALCILCPKLPQHSILSGTQIWLTVPFLSSSPRSGIVPGRYWSPHTHTHTSLCPSIPLTLHPSVPPPLCIYVSEVAVFSRD
jgi:hypothetical protein